MIRFGSITVFCIVSVTSLANNLELFNPVEVVNNSSIPFEILSRYSNGWCNGANVLPSKDFTLKAHTKTLVIYPYGVIGNGSNFGDACSYQIEGDPEIAMKNGRPVEPFVYIVSFPGENTKIPSFFKCQSMWERPVSFCYRPGDHGTPTDRGYNVSLNLHSLLISDLN